MLGAGTFIWYSYTKDLRTKLSGLKSGIEAQLLKFDKSKANLESNYFAGDISTGKDLKVAATVTTKDLNIENNLTVQGSTTLAGLNVTSGNVSLPSGSIDNSELANSALTYNAGSGLTGGGLVPLGGSATFDIGAGPGISVGNDDISVIYGHDAHTAVEGNQSIGVSAGTNLAGGGTLTLGSGGTLTLNTVSNPTFSTSVTAPILNLTNSGFTTSLQTATLTGNQTITLPNATGDVCVSTGNCAGLGGTVSGAGTTNYVAKFTSSSGIGNSSIFDNGNVGIGTTNPSSLVHIYADQNSGTKLNIDNPNTGTGAFAQLSAGAAGNSIWNYAFGTGYTTSGRFVQASGLVDSSGSGGLGIAASNASGVLRFYTNGNNERVRIDSTGNVGIGTTSPITKLANTATTVDDAVTATSGDALTWSINNTGPAAALYNSGVGAASNGLLVKTAVTAGTSTYILNALAGSTSRLYVASGGNVGIGTAAPGAQLQISIGSPSTTGQIIKGATSQTGNLLEFQNSGSGLLARFTAAGQFQSGSSSGYYFDPVNQQFFFGTNSALTGITSTSGIKSNVASYVAFGIQGAASQTADLQEWLGSTGTVLARVDASGNGFFANGAGGTGAAFVQGGNTFGGTGTLGLIDANRLDLITSNTPRLSILSGGNIGIGTTAPGSKLHINDTSQPFSGEIGSIRISDAANTNKKLYFGFDNTLGTSGSGYIQSVFSGTSFLPTLINPNGGNVGIGTTNPGSILDVRKTTTGGTTNFDFYNTESTSTTLGQSARIRLAPWSGFVGTNLAPYVEGLIDTAGEAGLAFGTYPGGSAIERMRITYAGNVGIGNTAPASLFSVGSTSQFQVNSSGQVTYVDGTTNTATAVCKNSSGQLAPCNTTGAGAAYIQGGNTFGAVANLGSNDNFGLALRTNGTERVRIDTSGNVGIGTTNPGAKLWVNGNIRGGTSGNSIFGPLDGDYGGNMQVNGDYLRILNSSNGPLGELRFGFSDANGARINGQNNVGLWLTTNNNERLRIDNNGNVGIGTTAPGYKLDISGGNLNIGGQNLYLGGTMRISDTANAAYTQINPQGGLLALLGGNSYLAYNSSNNKNISLSHNGTAALIAAGNAGGGNSPIYFQTSGTVQMAIDTSGNVGIGTTAPGAKLEVDAAASGIGQIIKANATTPGDLLQLQDSSGNVNGKFGATGAVLTLGRVAASGVVTQGNLIFADGTTDNFSGTILPTTLTASRTYTLPDASGTICVSGSTCASSGTLGYWSRSGTTITPATSGDTLSVPGAGTGSEKFGAASSAAGNFSAAIGANSSAAGTGSNVFGNTASSAQANSVVIGNSASASDGAQSGSVAIGAGATSGSTGNVVIGLSSTASATNSVVIGRAASTAFDGSIVLGAFGSTTAANQLIIGSGSAPITSGYFGKGVTNASPTGFTLNATGGSGSNIAGASLTLAGGQGTGTGVGGNLVFQYAAAGSTGSSLNALATACTISGTNGSLSCPGAGASSERFGTGSLAAGSQATAVGQGASAGGLQTIAIGAGASSGGAASIAIGTSASSAGTGGTAIGYATSAAGDNSVALGRTSTTASGNLGSVAIGYGAVTNAANQLVIGASSNNTYAITSGYIGNGVTNAAPLGFTLNGTGGSGTDIAGAALTFAGGQGTGTGAGGIIAFKTATPAGSTGSSLNTLTERMRIDTNGNVGIGTTAPLAKLDVTYDHNTSLSGFGLSVGVNSNSTGDTQNYISNFVNNNSANITNVRGLRVDSGFLGAASTGNVTNFYGMVINGPRQVGGSAGTATNSYQLKLENGAALSASNSYGLYQTDAVLKNYFAGNVGIGTTAPGAKLEVDAAASGIGQIIKANATTPGDLLQLQDSSGNVNAKFGASGAVLTLGRVASSGTVTQGNLLFADGTTDNFSGTILPTTLTASRTYTLPDSTGTFCLNSGNCSGTSGGYILNGTSTQTANFRIQSADPNFRTAVIMGAASQVQDIFEILGSASTDYFHVGNLGRAYSGAGITATDQQVNNQGVPLLVQGFFNQVTEVVKGAASQTSDLLQFQNSGGTVLSEFTIAGALQGGNVSGTNIAGTALTLNGGQGTGTGVGGNINFQYAAAGSTGSSLNALATACTISGTNGSLSCLGAGSSSERFGLSSTAAGNSSVAIGNTASSGGASSTAVGQGASSAGQGGIAIGNTAVAANTGDTALGWGASASGTNSIALGRSAVTASGHTGSIAIGFTATTTAANQLVIGSTNNTYAITSGYIGNGVTNAAPLGFTLNGTGGSGTDITGANLTLAGGKGTGAGAGGALIFQTAAASTTGSSLNALTERMRIDTNGNVGIGTTGPLAKLHTVGAESRLQTDNAFYSLYNTAGTRRAYLQNVESTAELRLVQEQAGGFLSFYTATVEKMRIDAAGNVGIGTTAPGQKLEINSGSAATAVSVAITGGRQWNLVSGANSVNSRFDIRDNSAAADRLSIDLNGNVGIGTTSPAGLLNITKAISGTPSLTGQYLNLSASTFTDNNTAGSGTAASMAFNSIAQPTLAATNTLVTTTNAYNVWIAGGPIAGTNQTITNSYAFGIGVNGSATSPAFVVTGDGRAAINTTAAANTLLQVGNTGVNGFSTSSAVNGISARAVNTGTGDIVALTGQAVTTNAGTVSNLVGMQGWIRSAGGAGAIVTNGKAFEALSPQVSSGTVTNAYGLYINQQKVAGVTNGYGIYQTNSGDLNYFAGNVGIGTSAPSTKLSTLGSVSAAGGAIDTITNNNTTDSVNTVTLRLNTGATSTTTNARFVTFYAGVTSGDTGGTGVGNISLNNNNVNYGTGGADYAEYFAASDSSLSQGDIVGLDASGKAVKATDSTPLVGVLSTTAGFTGNDTSDSATNNNKAIVGLLGQLPVKVATDSASIKAGDPITASSTPGFAKRATNAGPIIGHALEDYDPTTAGGRMLRVALNVGWADPSNALAGLTLDSSGNLVLPTTPDAEIASLGGLNPNPQTLTPKHDLAWTLSDLVSRVGKLEKGNVPASSSTAVPNSATDSAKLNDLTGKVDSLNSKFLTLDSKIASLEATLSTYNLALVTNASSSAQIGLDNSSSTNATLSGTLSVAGRTLLSDVGITGKVNVGLLSINGLDNSTDSTGQNVATINTSSGPLKLQSDGFNGVDILNGKVVIATDGSMKVEGTLTVKKLNIDTGDVAGASLGTDTIRAGETKTTIKTTGITDKSHVFTSLDQPLDFSIGITGKKPGESFDAEITKPATKDIKFSWWIIN